MNSRKSSSGKSKNSSTKSGKSSLKRSKSEIKIFLKALQEIVDRKLENGCITTENYHSEISKRGFKESESTTRRGLQTLGYKFTNNTSGWEKRTKTAQEVKQDYLINELNDTATYATEIFGKVYSFAIRTKLGNEHKIAQLISESFNKTSTFAIPCVKYVLVLSYNKSNLTAIHKLIHKSNIKIKIKETNKAT